jgi:hypothetical protein
MGKYVRPIYLGENKYQNREKVNDEGERHNPVKFCIGLLIYRKRDCKVLGK